MMGWFTRKHGESRIAGAARTGVLVASTIGLVVLGGIISHHADNQSYGATFSSAPSGSQVCPGHADAATLTSPYTTFASAQAAFPGKTYTELAAGSNQAALGNNSAGVSSAIASNALFYFDAGVHTIGTNANNQVQASTGDVFVGAPGAVFDGNSVNHFAFTDGGAIQSTPNVTIEYLEIRNFSGVQDNSAVNQNAGISWTIKYDYVHDNTVGAGVTAGSQNTLQYNCLAHNGQLGVDAVGGTNFSNTGVYGVTLDHNEVMTNNTFGYDIAGSSNVCGCSGGFKFWGAVNSTITNNYIHDNQGVGLWCDTDCVGFDVENNTITNSYYEAIMYEISYNAYIHNNYMSGNAYGFIRTAASVGFPAPTIYISSSGADSRASVSTVAGTVSPGSCGTHNCGTSLDITNNSFVDNGGGVVLYEDPNRYCFTGSTDSGCTLVNAGATKATCASSSISTNPLLTDCRWRTSNVNVASNLFALNRANLSTCNSGSAYTCGQNGLMSAAGGCSGVPCGGWPATDPYLGTFVENNVTYNQNNKFQNNSYTGTWCYDPFAQGASAAYSVWRAGPAAGGALGSSAYNQDPSSLYPSPNTSC
jgi:hypothetical protein